MRVHELMHRSLRTIATDATVAEAVDVLTAAGVSALPVLDRFGRAVGVLSTRELLAAEARCQTPADRDRLFDRTLVLEVMAPWPAVAHPETDVADAARAMLRQRVQRLFVEDHGALVGVISQTDIVGAVAAARI
jgi:CBS domain-containing protein